MRTLFYLFAAFLLTQPLFAQSSTITGTVAIFNSRFETGKREFVANAQVEDDYKKSNATITDAGGHFKLSLVGIQDREKVFYSVKKSGLEVVNIDALQAVAGQSEATRVFMAPEGKIAENKLKYYKINREASEKALTERLKSLEKQIAAAQSDAVRLKGLQDEYGQLQAQFDKIEETARDLAERYARTNLDDVSADYQRAFRCFQRGQLDSALLIFKAIDLEADAAGIISEQGRNADLAAEYERRDSEKNKRKRETNEALRFKAQLHETRFEFERAEETYLLLLRLDSTDIFSLWPFADFLAIQNQHYKAIKQYEKCVKLSKSEYLKSIFLANMGASYIEIGFFKQSEMAFDSSLSVIEKFNISKSQDVTLEVANIYNNLASVYLKTNRYSLAELFYKKALEVFNSLNDRMLMFYDSELGTIHNNLGSLFLSKHDFLAAESEYKVALKIRKRLTKINPQTYSVDLASTETGLGKMYREQYKLTDAEAALKEAFEIYKRLAETNPQSHEHNLANIQNELGLLYSEKGDYFGALTSFNVSIKIYVKLGQFTPGAYEADLAIAKHNLGTLFLNQYELTKAEEELKDAFEIRKRLTEADSQAHEADLGHTLLNLGILYKTKNNIPKAEKFLNDALVCYRRSANISPQSYDLYIANALFNLGNLFGVKNEFKQAERAYLEAVEIRKRFAKSSETHRPLVAQIQNTLGILYVKMDDIQLAKAAFEEALSILANLSDSTNLEYQEYLGDTYNNLGTLLSDNGGLEQAETYYLQALKTFEKLNSLQQDSYVGKQEQIVSGLLSIYQQWLEADTTEAEKIPVQKKAVALYKYLALQYPDNDAFAQNYASALGSLAWYHLFAHDFEDSENSGRYALSIDPTQAWIKTNLAHALLFQSKFEEATEIYMGMKDLIYEQEPTKKYGEILLDDLNILEKSGIAHPDIPKIRLLLQQK